MIGAGDTVGEIMVETVGVRPPKAEGTYRKYRQPYQERKEAHANCEVLPSGEMSLHRVEPKTDIGMGWKDEKPWHRVAAWMVAEGQSDEVVARVAGVAEETVRQLRRQTWFSELVATFASQTGRGYAQRIAAEAEKSLEKLLSIRDDESYDEGGKPIVSARTKADVSKFLIEQVHGKAVQKVISISANTNFSSEQEEREALLAELQALRGRRRERPPEETQIPANP